MNRFSLLSVALLACAACASAADPELEKVRKQVMTALPGIAKDDIRASSAPGLYEIRKGSAYGYVTADGRYLIQGDMVDLVTGEEVTEKQRMAERTKVLNQFGPDRIIEFAAKNAKHVVTIYTDIDCGYCRKLHAEMEDYHKQGITVRYLFFPRSGPQTASFRKAESVWCTADRHEALTQAKRGVNITTPPTCSNPILDHYRAAEALGVNATPMIILEDGEIVRGYVPAQSLAARIQQGSWRKPQARAGD
jgi:thiol:disulfide interchange protein DsbC